MEKFRSFFLFISLMGFCSCSAVKLFVKEKEFSLRGFQKHTTKDYVQHLDHVGMQYIQTPNIKIFELSKKNQKYFEKIFKKIVENNELILEQKHRPKIYIVKNQVPFNFSLPGAKFFFSLGLIKNYMKNEGVLIASFAFEILKSVRKLYPKRMYFPKGFISTGEILALTRLPFSARVKLHKWTFNVLKRSRFDPYSHLMWVQIQNKNPLDFSFQHGHNNKMIREEYFLKNFILKEIGPLEKKQLVEKNSSKAFYDLIKSLKKS